MELLAVLIIMALLGALAVPRFGSAIARQNVDAASKRIVNDLGLARKRAMLTDSIQKVTFDAVAESYVLDGMTDPLNGAAQYTVKLTEEPYGVDLVNGDFTNGSESMGDKVVEFDIYGTPDSAGWVEIKNGTERLWVTLDGSTGQSKIWSIKPPQAY